MKIEEILSTKGRTVACIDAGDPLVLAANRLIGENVGCLVVTDPAGAVVGLITERDIVRAVVRGGTAVLDRPVRLAMTTRVATCRPDDRVSTAMATVTSARQRHLPVVEHGELRGIVSVGDLVKARLDNVELEARVLRDVYITHH
jgi:CBS domain-containing protein